MNLIKYVYVLNERDTPLGFEPEPFADGKNVSNILNKFGYLANLAKMLFLNYLVHYTNNTNCVKTKIIIFKKKFNLFY